jgi:hypothetical protein
MMMMISWWPNFVIQRTAGIRSGRSRWIASRDGAGASALRQEGRVYKSRLMFHHGAFDEARMIPDCFERAVPVRQRGAAEAASDEGAGHPRAGPAVGLVHDEDKEALLEAPARERRPWRSAGGRRLVAPRGEALQRTLVNGLTPRALESLMMPKRCAPDNSSSGSRRETPAQPLFKAIASVLLSICPASSRSAVRELHEGCGRHTNQGKAS